MAENPFGQVLVALVTPFTADGEVDWPGVEKHIDSVITAGADGIVVSGTTGETSTLTDPEKLRLVEVARDWSRRPREDHPGRRLQRDRPCDRAVQEVRARRRDGVMIVTPYYNKPTQAGLLTHFRMVADATDLPVILYGKAGRGD